MARVSWQGQFNDAALGARLAALARFDPVAPPPLADAPGQRPDVVSIGRLRTSLGQAAPIDDLLAWLAAQLTGASLGELVRAYVALSPIAAPNAGSDALRDEHWLARPDGRIGYRPLAIEHRP